MVVLATGNRNERDIRATGPVFTLTNWTEDLAIDCNSATNDELSDMLGTLIKTLIERGIINGTVASA